jgi:hypothetical protein
MYNRLVVSFIPSSFSLIISEWYEMAHYNRIDDWVQRIHITTNIAQRQQFIKRIWLQFNHFADTYLLTEV